MHGLLFGGVTSPLEEDMTFDEWSSAYAELLDGKKLQAERGLYTGLETYRSFGNHRIATYLRKNGWDVECLDYTIFFTNEQLIEYLEKRITKETVFVGFSLMFYTMATKRLSWFTDHIRKKYPWVKIISGGQKTWTVTCVEADYYITGNGEYAMDALLKHLMGQGPEPIIHKTMKNGGKLITAQHSYPCFPKRDANISYEERDFIHPSETLNVEFSRGCIFSCKYCSFPLLGMKQDTTRNEDSLYEELLENYERWGTTSYYITDDTVNDSKDKLASIARAVRKLPFRPHFSGYARADLLIRHGKDTWDDMIDAGFTSHSYGIETFNHKSGKTVGKGMKPEEMKEGLLKIEDYFNEKSHLFYSGTFTMIAGLPFETFDTLESTKDWVNKYWGGHVVAYLPLILSAPDNEQADDIDIKVYNNFMDYGYTYSYDRPFIADEGLRNKVETLTTIKRNNKNRDNTEWNFWVHPSGDYDFVDMIEWVGDFTQERVMTGKNPAGVWQINHVHAETYNNPSDAADYYKQNPKNLPHKALINIIRQYKKDKLHG